jgi:hypothetical protein
MCTGGSFTAFDIPSPFQKESPTPKRPPSPCYNYLFRSTTFVVQPGLFVPTIFVVRLSAVPGS